MPPALGAWVRGHVILEGVVCAGTAAEVWAGSSRESPARVW